MEKGKKGNWYLGKPSVYQLPGRACPHRGQEVLVQPRDLQAAECRVSGNVPSLLCMDHRLRCTQGLGRKPDGGRGACGTVLTGDTWPA